MLNTQSPIPLYQQLAAQLRRDIESGVLSADDKIPSENELAQRLGIGRPTVRQATDLLVREGVLQRRRGSGTYVLPPGKRIDLFSLAGTSAALGESQVSSDVEILRPVSRHEPGACGPESMRTQSLYTFDRLTRIDDDPVLLEQFYLDAERFPDFEQVSLQNASLSRVVRETYFLEPTSAEQTFAIASNLPDIARQLQIDVRVPLLHVSRSLHFGAFATLACTGLTGYPSSRFWLLVGLVAFAVGIEIIQTYIPVRSAEVADFLADIVGIFVGFAAARIGQLIMDD